MSFQPGLLAEEKPQQRADKDSAEPTQSDKGGGEQGRYVGIS
jgi:hypothetical protein